MKKLILPLSILLLLCLTSISDAGLFCHHGRLFRGRLFGWGCGARYANSVVVHSSPVVVEKAPVVIEQPPIVIQQSPVIIQNRLRVRRGCASGRCSIH